jgi:malate dehydrogenase (oxaloacetate-decarboxylating)
MQFFKNSFSLKIHMSDYTQEELQKKKNAPAINAIKMHQFYHGKMQTLPRCGIQDYKDFSYYYSPGVAAPCMEIHNDFDKVFEYTSKWNYVAVVSDGTRVLGLGDIGPESGLPVMEGKALLFKYLGGVDAFPMCIGPNMSAEQIIQCVKWIQPTFGGINLEDIEKPKCFKVLDTLRNDPEVQIPVWHDDQQGTAAVTLAGLINAVKIVGKERGEVKIVFNGIGASNFAISRVLGTAGFDTKKALYVDSKGILTKSREDLQDPEDYKYEIALNSNPEEITGDLSDALQGADIMISLSASKENLIPKSYIATMANDSIVFSCENPTPAIWPEDAMEAGCKIFATGRGDFPNQVNNSLGFPGIFRGALDVRAKTISDEMCIVAAEALAKVAEDEGLSENYIIPKMDNKEVFIREAVAVGLKAIEQNIHRIKLTEEELWNTADKLISDAQAQTKLLMREGFIPEFTDYE